ncbi:hypothetical protein KP509_1Z077700 [Ceratopteris richardii]|nr:hypothetical protein KP509_1Z077700 [Ceratopteris richardii]
MTYSLSLHKGGAFQQQSRRSSGHRNGRPRRFSLSTPDELGEGRTPTAASFAHASSLSDEEYLDSDNLQALLSSGKHGPGGEPSSFSSSRVQRLLQQRQLKNDAEAWCRGDGWMGRATLSVDYVSKLLPNCTDNGREGNKQRLLVVANRLPVSATRNDDGWSLKVSAGGLVSALLGVRQFETRWIGWAGVNVTDEADKAALAKALDEQRCVPVFLDEETMHQYYNGYCNNVLWPLFHYLGLPQEDRLSCTRGLEDQFEAYKRANNMFADVVYSVYREGDVVWCHDYHLMFLPKCLKERDSTIKVGWFLHTPFPSSEIYRTLPSRSKLLKAVLSADLIGFHTYDYARHFVSACTRILGLEGTPSGVEDHPLGKFTRVAAWCVSFMSCFHAERNRNLALQFQNYYICWSIHLYKKIVVSDPSDLQCLKPWHDSWIVRFPCRFSKFPIGIDPDRFIDALETPEVQKYIEELREKFLGRKVMLGVDRLDMIKGIPQKLLAFEKFLDENVDWRDKVQLVQIAVPTRTDVHDCMLNFTILMHHN